MKHPTPYISCHTGPHLYLTTSQSRVKSVDYPSAPLCSPLQVEAILKAADGDGDRKIDLKEFHTIMAATNVPASPRGATGEENLATAGPGSKLTMVVDPIEVRARPSGHGQKWKCRRSSGQRAAAALDAVTRATRNSEDMYRQAAERHFTLVSCLVPHAGQRDHPRGTGLCPPWFE